MILCAFFSPPLEGDMHCVDLIFFFFYKIISNDGYHCFAKGAFSFNTYLGKAAMVLVSSFLIGVIN